MEQWKIIPGFSLYEASSFGNIRHVKHKKVRSLSILKGYARCTISDDNNVSRPYLVHRLVYMAFNGDIPQDKVVDHINRIRDDNRLENLRLATHSENNLNKLPYVRGGVSLERIVAIIELYDSGLSPNKIHQKLKKTPA